MAVPANKVPAAPLMMCSSSSMAIASLPELRCASRSDEVNEGVAVPER